MMNSIMLFILLYPCLTSLQSESKQIRFTLLSLGLAWLVSMVFYQGARALGY